MALQKTTLLDYPGEVAATLFTPGCNLRCPYCHNPELVTPPFPDDLLGREEILSFLRKRAGILGGVCITGGEPLMHRDLPELADEIHGLGLKVKIDTNGTMPERIEAILPKIDYVAMDVKTAPRRYGELGMKAGGTASDAASTIAETIIHSIRAIIESGVEHEFRTTCLPGLVEEEDIREITEAIKGAAAYYIVQFRPSVTLDPAAAEVTPYSPDKLEGFRVIAEEAGLPVKLRGQ